MILDEVLDPYENELSTYRVADLEELYKIAVTVCLRRGMGDVRFYVITPDDLQSLTTPILSPANCDIPCYWTRSRHHDLRLDRSERERLSLVLAAATGRDVSPKLKKHGRRLQPYLDRATADKCYSTTRPPTECAHCDPAGQHVL